LDDLILSLFCPQAGWALTFSLDEKVNKKSSQSDTVRHSMGTYLPESRQIDDSRSERPYSKEKNTAFRYYRILDFSPFRGDVDRQRGALLMNNYE